MMASSPKSEALRRSQAAPLLEETAKETLARWHTAGRLLSLPGTATDPLYFHKRLKLALERAGLLVRSIKKEQFHDLWVVRLKARRWHVESGAPGVKEPLVQIFRRFGCKMSRSDFEVIPHGNRLTIAFLWNRGCPGVLVT